MCQRHVDIRIHPHDEESTSHTEDIPPATHEMRIKLSAGPVSSAPVIDRHHLHNGELSSKSHCVSPERDEALVK